MLFYLFIYILHFKCALHYFLISVCKNILFYDTRIIVNNFFVIFVPAIEKIRA